MSVKMVFLTLKEYQFARLWFNVQIIDYVFINTIKYLKID